jgi:rSAM/selenodomain-associated transferase 2
MLSIVIPTLNEADNLKTTIGRCVWAAEGAPIEFIVSDCGSSDGTLALANRLQARLATGSAHRAEALNRGAALASGEMLLFLHADTLPPRGFVRTIQRILSDPFYVGGAFDVEFCCDPSAELRDLKLLRWVIMLNRLRYRWSGNFHGNQAIFVRRDIFQRVGGFPNVSLMEDIGLSRRLHRYGKTAIVNRPVRTSPRRFLARGVVRQALQNTVLLALDSLSIRPHRLWEDYNQLNAQTES